MGQLAQPVQPARLYRYRSFSRDAKAFGEQLAAITQNHLWCSDFTRMNDPMEGYYTSSSLVQAKSDYERVAQLIADRKTGVGIASFTETPDDILMWTHYASNHSGICIEYSTQRLLDGLPHEALLVRVAYVDKPPRVSTADARNLDATARKILSQKRYTWSSEREWRVLAPKGPVSIGLKQAITAIYMGSRIDPRHRHRLLQNMHGKDIRTYMMQVDGYQHDWKSMSLNVKQAAAKKLKSKVA